jgi:hypothetical protein
MTAYTEAQTDLVDRCCRAIGFAAAANDFATGVERGLHEFAPDPAAGARYDPERAAACLAELRDTDCTELLKAAHGSAACDDVYRRGHLQLGDECHSNYDCARPDGDVTGCFATIVDGDLTRICTRLVLAGEGESCAGGGDATVVFCEGNLLCDDSSTCVRYAARGEPCLTGPAWGDTCEVGSVCDRMDTQRCIEPTPVGEGCDTGDNRCEGLACVAGICREPLFVTSGAGYCTE